MCVCVWFVRMHLQHKKAPSTCFFLLLYSQTWACSTLKHLRLDLRVSLGTNLSAPFYRTLCNFCGKSSCTPAACGCYRSREIWQGIKWFWPSRCYSWLAQQSGICPEGRRSVDTDLWVIWFTACLFWVPNKNHSIDSNNQALEIRSPASISATFSHARAQWCGVNIWLLATLCLIKNPPSGVCYRINVLLKSIKNVSTALTQISY